MSPAVAARRCGPSTLLLQRPKSSVVHVSAPPVGRGRPIKRPLCKTVGKRWRVAVTTARRLCLRCDRAVRATTAPSTLTPGELAQLCAAAADARALDEVVHLVVMNDQVMAKADGVLLHQHIAQARRRLGATAPAAAQFDGWR